MKRKVLSLLLVVAMGMSLLVGCGGSDKNTSGDSNQENDTNVSQEAGKEKDEGITVFDNGDVLVKRTKSELDETGDFYVYHNVENKLDKRICVTIFDTSINGFEDSMFYGFKILEPGGVENIGSKVPKDDIDLFESNGAFFDNIMYEIYVFDATNYDGDDTLREMKKWYMGMDNNFNADELMIAKEVGNIFLKNNTEVEVIETITYTLDGVQYTFPTQVSELVKNGWSLGEAGEAPLDAGASYELLINKGEGVLDRVVIKNMTDERLLMNECTIVSMEVPFINFNVGIEFITSNGLGFESTEGQFMEMCGEAQIEDRLSLYTCESTSDGTAKVTAEYDSEGEMVVRFCLEDIATIE